MECRGSDTGKPHRTGWRASDLSHSELSTSLFFFNRRFVAFPGTIGTLTLVSLRVKCWWHSKTSRFLQFPQIASEEKLVPLSAPRDPNIIPPSSIGCGTQRPKHTASLTFISGLFDRWIHNVVSQTKEARLPHALCRRQSKVQTIIRPHQPPSQKGTPHSWEASKER